MNKVTIRIDISLQQGGGSEVVDQPPADHFQTLPCLSAIRRSVHPVVVSIAVRRCSRRDALFDGIMERIVVGRDRDGGSCAENKLKV